MKHLFLFFALLFFGTVNAQDTLKLKINNPAPRVGDEIEISFSLEFITQEIENQIKGDVIVSNDFYYGTNPDYFRKTLEFTKAGEQTVGPFKFDFNGKTFVTDSVTISVDKKLPFEEGVWIRVAQDGYGQKYLIIEQLIGNKSDYKKEKDGFSYTAGGEKDDNIEFADLDKENIDEVSIGNSQSMENTRTAEGADIFAPGLRYSFKKYTYTVSDRFEGTFSFKKKHFKNLPKKAYFNDLTEER